MQEVFAVEHARMGFGERCVLGWHNAKSYVGITYMWGEDSEATCEVFLSKYVVIDPSFTNMLGREQWRINLLGGFFFFVYHLVFYDQIDELME